MLEMERFADVTRLRMSSVRTRAAGLDVSAYLVRGVLVDTGFTRAATEVARALDELAPRAAILTHWHEDHAGNVPLFVARGLPTWVAPASETILRLHAPIRLYRRATWGWPAPFESPLAPDDLGGLEPLHTPGHSPDHHVVWDAATETLFSGDLWLGTRVKVMHESEDPYQIVDSLRRAAALRPRRMFDAHRGEVADPVRALEGKAEWMEATAGEIERAIAAGMDDAEILSRVLGGEEMVGYASGREYARINFVRAVRERVTAVAAPLSS